MANDRVVIVGAGIGGLVAAAVLAHEGVSVTVLEQSARVGGKLRTLQAGGREVDAGPTVFTLRPWFEQMFARVGESLDAHLTLERLGVLARHAWPDGSRLDLHADPQATAAAITTFSNADEAGRYLRFCERSERIFRALEQSFMRAPQPGNPLSLMARTGLRGMPDLLGISPFNRLMQELQREFTDPRLIQLFGRYATYCGSSPWLAPGTLMLVAHAERIGVSTIAGGMHRLASAMADIARNRGATVRCQATVSRILVERNRVAGVQLDDGERIDAGMVLFNGDVSALAQGLLGESVVRAAPRFDARRRSLSALTWTGLAAISGFPLAHHTVFFSDDYDAEFRDLFDKRRLPQAPTVYVCAQDRLDGSGAAGSEGAERLLCLVNAPAIGDAGGPPDEEIARCERTMLAHLRRCGLGLRWNLSTVTRTSPADFNALFPGTGGALYGMATHGWQASFQRPGAQTAIPGLYLAGGSAHPGPGLPMAATSGLIAAETMLAKRSRTSISTSRPAGTRGGTSTR